MATWGHGHETALFLNDTLGKGQWIGTSVFQIFATGPERIEANKSLFPHLMVEN